MFVLGAISASAQWLNYPNVRLPRLANGKPNLAAPAPRTTEGRPDLSGVWQANATLAYLGNIVADLRADEIIPWADAVYRQRMANLGTDDPSTLGCLPRGPRYFIGSPVAQIIKIIETPELVTILYEDLAYRQVFTDGRSLPTNPNPSFMGYSVGHWDGDTLVVESAGFNDRTWLDFGGHPHTEALHIIEKYRRASVGRLSVEVEFSDPGAYRRSWTVPVDATLAADTDLIEFVCNENDERRTHVHGRTSEQVKLTVSEEMLSQYAGIYDASASARLPFKTLRVRHVGRDLFLDLDDRGNWLMVPLSNASFSTRLIDLTFRRDTQGAVHDAIVGSNGVMLIKRR